MMLKQVSVEGLGANAMLKGEEVVFKATDQDDHVTIEQNGAMIFIDYNELRKAVEAL